MLLFKFMYGEKSENCIELCFVFLWYICKTENREGLMRSDAICLSDAPGFRLPTN